MGGRRMPRVEIAGDLSQTPPRRVLCPDVTNELVGDDRGPSRRRRRHAPSSGSTSLVHKPLELVDRNEPRAPWHINRLDERQDPPAEGGRAHPERCGCLRPRVDESLDLSSAAKAGYR